MKVICSMGVGGVSYCRCCCGWYVWVVMVRVMGVEEEVVVEEIVLVVAEEEVEMVVELMEEVWRWGLATETQRDMQT